MRISNRLEKHAVAASIVALGAAAAANAAIVRWDINLAVPATFDGLYIRIDTQTAVSTAGSTNPGWDINPYGSGTNLSFFASATAPNPATTYVRTQASGGPSSLAGGTVISASSTFTNATTAVVAGTTPANGWQLNAINYFGFRFHNGTTNAINYGYGAMQIGANGGARTLLFIEYGNEGESVTVVPAPGAIALLGLAGFAGRRRR